MSDWNTRLEVKLAGRTISPITNFSPSFNVPHTVIHSLEADGVGYVRQPFTFTFTLTIPAIASAVADLTELAVNGGEFAIAVAEKKGNDWAFSSLKFSRCVVSAAQPSNITVDGVPQATFTCMALNVGVED
ncbi:MULTISPECIES: hypothetical protein [Streptomyces]|uniref:Uncharacterized protein n=2 Tax=Streptomyces TaxID=1883 RepID=A0A4Y3RW32_9ACTN|nr:MULTISPECIES: hypothetical protein [Streptomyces]ALO05898.1 hypothetical protein AQF52_0298 [Streptomyces venezuelae]QES24242.1 hypothetical protein DEJ46_38385 [Streptomyces venezuelae]QPK43423.1 hypothetical protein H4W23_01420 [Streptomyces gardneri]WRK34649.1 hypothetical protein U0M97_01425 [Streptomyces venezuelae]CUM43885.1 hypothetical protein BN2537_16735 [Streptomyces venezuelae]